MPGEWTRSSPSSRGALILTLTLIGFQATTVEERQHAAAWLEDTLGVKQAVNEDGSLGAMRSAVIPDALAARVRRAADL